MEKTRDERDEGKMCLDLCSFTACLQPCQWLDSSVLQHAFGLMSSSGKLFFSLCGWIVFPSPPIPPVNVLIGSAMLCSLPCVRVTGTGSEDRVQVVNFVSKCRSLLNHLSTSVLFESRTLSPFCYTGQPRCSEVGVSSRKCAEESGEDAPWKVHSTPLEEEGRMK